MLPKETFKPFIALFLAGILIVLLLYLVQQITDDSTNPPPNPPEEISPTAKMSFGENILINRECQRRQTEQIREFKELKLEAINAVKENNYNQAISYFEQARRSCPNTPETLIYLNNAKIGEQQAYTIAVIVPSRSNTNNALEMLRGFAQAQWEINQQGGIEGTPLKLLIVNDEDSPEVAKEIADDLVKKEDVLAVTGHWTSDVSLAAAPIYEDNKLVFITPVSTTNKLSDYQDYVFQTHMINNQTSEALAKYVFRNWDIPKAAVFYVKDVTYSEELKNGFRQVLETSGGDVVTTIDLGDPEFDAQSSWQQARNAGSEGLFFVSDNDSVDEAIKVIRVNNGELKLLGEVNLYSTNTLIQSQEDALGLVIALAWHSSNLQNDDNFITNSVELWGTKSVNHVTATSYNAMQALITALQKSQNPNRESIQKALKARDFSADGAGEKVRFSSRGERKGKVQLVEVKQKITRDGYEFVPIPDSEK